MIVCIINWIYSQYSLCSRPHYLTLTIVKTHTARCCLISVLIWCSYQMPLNMRIRARMHRHAFTELKEGTWKMRKQKHEHGEENNNIDCYQRGLIGQKQR